MNIHPKIKLIKNNVVRIIIEWMLNSPLKPSIKLEPFIINKKHKETKNNAKISISKSSFKKSIPVFSI